MNENVEAVLQARIAELNRQISWDESGLDSAKEHVKSLTEKLVRIRIERDSLVLHIQANK